MRTLILLSLLFRMIRVIRGSTNTRVEAHSVQPDRCRMVSGMACGGEGARRGEAPHGTGRS